MAGARGNGGRCTTPRRERMLAAVAIVFGVVVSVAVAVADITLFMCNFFRPTRTAVFRVFLPTVLARLLAALAPPPLERQKMFMLACCYPSLPPALCRRPRPPAQRRGENVGLWTLIRMLVFFRSCRGPRRPRGAAPHRRRSCSFVCNYWKPHIRVAFSSSVISLASPPSPLAPHPLPVATASYHAPTLLCF